MATPSWNSQIILLWLDNLNLSKFPRRSLEGKINDVLNLWKSQIWGALSHIQFRLGLLGISSKNLWLIMNNSIAIFPAPKAYEQVNILNLNIMEFCSVLYTRFLYWCFIDYLLFSRCRPKGMTKARNIEKRNLLHHFAQKFIRTQSTLLS